MVKEYEEEDESLTWIPKVRMNEERGDEEVADGNFVEKVLVMMMSLPSIAGGGWTTLCGAHVM